MAFSDLLKTIRGAGYEVRSYKPGRTRRYQVVTKKGHSMSNFLGAEGLRNWWDGHTARKPRRRR